MPKFNMKIGINLLIISMPEGFLFLFLFLFFVFCFFFLKKKNYFYSDQYGVQVRYSTLADYFENLAEQDIEWPVYEKDFFPYADNGDSYWTGYFTSHSQLKG